MKKLILSISCFVASVVQTWACPSIELYSVKELYDEADLIALISRDNSGVNEMVLLKGSKKYPFDYHDQIFQYSEDEEVLSRQEFLVFLKEVEYTVDENGEQVFGTEEDKATKTIRSYEEITLAQNSLIQLETPEEKQAYLELIDIYKQHSFERRTSTIQEMELLGKWFMKNVAGLQDERLDLEVPLYKELYDFRMVMGRMPDATRQECMKAIKNDKVWLSEDATMVYAALEADDKKTLDYFASRLYMYAAEVENIQKIEDKIQRKRENEAIIFHIKRKWANSEDEHTAVLEFIAKIALHIAKVREEEFFHFYIIDAITQSSTIKEISQHMRELHYKDEYRFYSFEEGSVEHSKVKKRYEDAYSALREEYIEEAQKILDMCNDERITALAGKRMLWKCAEKSAFAQVEGFETELNLVVYPNPSPTGKINFHCQLPDKGDLKVKIVDVTGREVFSTIYEQVDGKFAVEIPHYITTQGVYFLQLTQYNKVISKSFVIQ